jgi:flagellar biosynthesis protein FlhA
MLMDAVRTTDPVVADDLNAANVTLGEMQRILEELLDENVAIRDLVRICEVVSERARATKDTEALVEAVRQALGPAISASYAPDGRLPVVSFEPMTEHALLETLRVGEGGTFLAIDPQTAEALTVQVAAEAERAEQAGHQPVLVCAARIRAPLARIVRTAAPRLPVLSYAELGPQLQLETLGVVNLAQPATV